MGTKAAAEVTSSTRPSTTATGLAVAHLSILCNHRSPLFLSLPVPSQSLSCPLPHEAESCCSAKQKHGLLLPISIQPAGGPGNKTGVRSPSGAKGPNFFMFPIFSHSRHFLIKAA